jgi:hypothetical protein
MLNNSDKTYLFDIGQISRGIVAQLNYRMQSSMFVSIDCRSIGLVVFMKIIAHDSICDTYSNEQSIVHVFSTKNRIDLQLEITRYIYEQLKRLNTTGSTILVNCPTMFDSKEIIMQLGPCLINIADTIANAFNLIQKIINVGLQQLVIANNRSSTCSCSCFSFKDIQVNPSELLLICAENIGKRHDYRSMQQFLQLIRASTYNDNQLHDQIIESCIKVDMNSQQVR